jgi:hypothetical protein
LWSADGEHGVPQQVPVNGPRPVNRQMHGSFPLGSGEPAGMFTRCRRRVAPRATAWALPASVPAARSRLWVIAASTVHALFAGKSPAYGPGGVDEVGEHRFDDRVLAVGDVRVGDRFGAVGEERVEPPDREQFIGMVLVADPAVVCGRPTAR